MWPMVVRFQGTYYSAYSPLLLYYCTVLVDVDKYNTDVQLAVYIVLYMYTWKLSSICVIAINVCVCVPTELCTPVMCVLCVCSDVNVGMCI